MSEEKRFTEREAHRHFAAGLFNHTWTLLDRAERTRAEEDEMLSAAYASRYHWGVVGEPSNLGIGEWQISRVNAVLKRPEAAAYHAERYLELATEHDLGAFHLAYAHEALARAAAVRGHTTACAQHTALARHYGEAVTDPEDKELLTADLATLPAS